MPIISLPSFDPNDEESWFLEGHVSRDEAENLLSKNEIGAFIVRGSTTVKGDLVLSVKENDTKFSHYIINRIPAEESPLQQASYKIGEQIFPNIPTLLTYYKFNNLDNTPLKVPAVPKDPLSIKSLREKLPVEAKVIQSRIPNAYDKTALTLQEGEIVRVTKVDVSGCWEGEVISSGRKGHFPFTCIKFIEDPIE